MLLVWIFKLSLMFVKGNCIAIPKNTIKRELTSSQNACELMFHHLFWSRSKDQKLLLVLTAINISAPSLCLSLSLIYYKWMELLFIFLIFLKFFIFKILKFPNYSLILLHNYFHGITLIFQWPAMILNFIDATFSKNCMTNTRHSFST